MTRSATQMQVLHAARDAALEQLRRDRPVLDELGQMFAAAGHQVDLVGGSVRDAILGRGWRIWISPPTPAPSR